MAFQKGQSGNPNGRPRKERTLSAILEKAGNAKRGTVAGKKLLADLLWEGATTGAVTFDDVAKPLAAQDWLTLVKFLYGQIDGPPKDGPSGDASDPLHIKFIEGVAEDDR